MRGWPVAFFLPIVAVCTGLPSEDASSQADSRIQSVTYKKGEVFVLRTIVGAGMRVVFSPGETVSDIGSGFSEGWDFSDSGNTLYIKAKSLKREGNGPSLEPKPGKWDTNLMVKTNLRMYDFDLQLLPLPKTGKAVKGSPITYRFEFRYPEEEAALAARSSVKDDLKEKLEVTPTPLNWNYSMQIGKFSDNIAPKAAYDDGRFTYLKFPNNRDFPAAFIVADDKTESIVNSHIDPKAPDVLVLHRVVKEMVLRLGLRVVGVYNDSYDQDGKPPVDGTTVPGVTRQLIGAAK